MKVSEVLFIVLSFLLILLLNIDEFEGKTVQFTMSGILFT